MTKKTLMIALDLDGTLTNHNKEVTSLTRKALLDAEENGAVLVLASGRPTYGILPVATCLEMENEVDISFRLMVEKLWIVPQAKKFILNICLRMCCPYSMIMRVSTAMHC